MCTRIGWAGIKSISNNASFQLIIVNSFEIRTLYKVDHKHKCQQRQYLQFNNFLKNTDIYWSQYVFQSLSDHSKGLSEENCIWNRASCFLYPNLVNIHKHSKGILLLNHVYSNDAEINSDMINVLTILRI